MPRACGGGSTPRRLEQSKANCQTARRATLSSRIRARSHGLAISPRDATLHLALGYYYQNLHDYQHAIEQYKLAMTYDPTDPRPKDYLSQAEALSGH